MHCLSFSLKARNPFIPGSFWGELFMVPRVQEKDIREHMMIEGFRWSIGYLDPQFSWEKRPFSLCKKGMLMCWNTFFSQYHTKKKKKKHAIYVQSFVKIVKYVLFILLWHMSYNLSHASLHVDGSKTLGLTARVLVRTIMDGSTAVMCPGPSSECVLFGGSWWLDGLKLHRFCSFISLISFEISMCVCVCKNVDVLLGNSSKSCFGWVSKCLEVGCKLDQPRVSLHEMHTSSIFMHILAWEKGPTLSNL